MRTVEDIRRYLAMSGEPYEEVGDGTWVIRLKPDDLQLVMRFDEPVLVFRMFVMAKPSKNLEAFYAAMLRMNARDLVHGAFGLEGEQVVLTCTLQVENLDLNEFQAVIDSFSLAIGQQRAELAKFL